MELKYNIGDEVFVKGIVRSVRVEKGHEHNDTDVIYTVAIGESYNSATRMDELEDDLQPSVNSGVPTSELRNLYKEMGEFMYYKDKKGEPITNVLDSCRTMLLDVIEAYERGDKE